MPFEKNLTPHGVWIINNGVQTKQVVFRFLTKINEILAVLINRGRNEIMNSRVVHFSIN